jgi:ABC-type Fe3+ transport system substrate-binding protein
MRRRWLIGLALLATLAGCDKGKPVIVLYSDQDRAVVEPLIQEFTKAKGIDVQVEYAPPESLQNGTGLSARLREEAGNPKADLYWGAGPYVMEKLISDNLLDSVADASLENIGRPFRQPDMLWAGLGARVRVLVYHSRRFPQGNPPRSLAALGQSAWKGRCALADPRRNANASYHLLCYFAAYGEREGAQLLRAIRTNQVLLLPDENAVIEAVASGKADWGITDSDRATEAMRSKKPIDFLVPDQGVQDTADALDKPPNTLPPLGTPVLPYPVALLRNRPHKRDSYLLRDFFFSPQTALKLAEKMPGALSTRRATSDNPPGKKDGQITNAHNLRFVTLSPEKLRDARSAFTLALADALP